MKHLSEERIQALVFGDEGEPPITAEEESHRLGCSACGQLWRQYDFSRMAVAPLREFRAPPARTNLAARALAAAREKKEYSWPKNLLRVARFEVPAFALAAVILLAVGLREAGSPRAGAAEMEQAVADAWSDDAKAPWPGTNDDEEAWARWILAGQGEKP